LIKVVKELQVSQSWMISVCHHNKYEGTSKINIWTGMASHTESELLSNRAKENLNTENDFQKFVDASPPFLINDTLIEILTST
jgi:hypothetical protein